MQDKAMLIDSSKCMGCRGCSVSCKQWNQLSAVTTRNTGSYENPPSFTPQTYTKVSFKEVADGNKVKWLFRKEQCMHCNTASCVAMCPVDARSKNEFGFTEIDKEKCIGCGICVNACPYGVPSLEDTTKKATGCRFCLDRVLSGIKPACAKTCPTGAIQFGDRKEMLSLGRSIEARSSGKLTLYGEKEFGGLHMIYLLQDTPAVYGLPKEGAAAFNKFELFAYLEDKFKVSPVKEEVLTAAALKYFGNVRI